MDLNLKNKIAIVTGASRGIGKSIAQTLSAEGVKLTLVARSPLDEFSASLPTESLPLSIDLRLPDSTSRVVEATLQKFGGIDILVNNAGATKRGDFLQLTDDEWTDGEIYDPESGKLYVGELKMNGDNSLKLNGHLKISRFLGKKQTWTRVK